MVTKINVYEPSSAEIKLVEVLSNPKNAALNITKLCDLANISRKTYYQIMKKPDFVEYKNAMTLEMIKGKIDNVVKATYKFATTDAKCAQDRKILLTMAGLYKDKQEIESTNSNLNLNAEVTILTDEALEAELNNLK